MPVIGKPLVVKPVLYDLALCSNCGYDQGGNWSTRPSNREREVLALVAQGLSNKMVAQQLGLHATTIKNHMTSIIKKTGRRDRTGAVMTALEQGWIRRVDDDSTEVGKQTQVDLEDGKDAGHARHAP